MTADEARTHAREWHGVDISGSTVEDVIAQHERAFPRCSYTTICAYVGRQREYWPDLTEVAVLNRLRASTRRQMERLLKFPVDELRRG